MLRELEQRQCYLFSKEHLLLVSKQLFGSTRKFRRNLRLLQPLLTYSSSEILPLRLRQRGSSISTAANWIFNYVSSWSVRWEPYTDYFQMIVQITPISIENIGWRTYIIFAVLNSLWVPLIFLFYPETKGLELEDVDHLFGGEDIVRNMDEKTNGTVVMLESVDRDGTGNA